MRNNFHYFKDRKSRARFICKFFNQYIGPSESILDVGCSENDLKKMIGEKVYGIDKAGAPDKRIDLEKEKLSIFQDNSFDMVVCTEVLEHIDNLYETLDDISRVTKKYILISLPNCSDIWKILRIILFSSTGKYYGLPHDNPGDRHKWFFSWKEADNFFLNYCQKSNMKIIESFLHFNYQDSGKEFILKTMLKGFPIKLFAQNYWILIEKKSYEVI